MPTFFKDRGFQIVGRKMSKSGRAESLGCS